MRVQFYALIIFGVAMWCLIFMRLQGGFVDMKENVAKAVKNMRGVHVTNVKHNNSHGVVTILEHEKKISRPIMAVCACTRSKSDWKHFPQTAVARYLIPSLERTVTPVERDTYDMRLYICHDDDDMFWERHKKEIQVPDWLTLEVLVYKKQTKHKIPFNPFMRDVYESGAEYMTRINDDTEFITSGWVSNAIAQLKKMDNVGVVGPTCRGGNQAILTHDMVHRTHLEIFDTYYSDVFSAWWVDDWITRVYEPGRMVKMRDWVVKHHTGMHGTRYTPQMNEEKFVGDEVRKGQERLKRWLNTNVITGLERSQQPWSVNTWRKYYRPSIQLKMSQIELIMSKVQLGKNFLVFGLGYDSMMWSHGLRDGSATLFVEDNREWINKIVSEHPTLQAEFIDYKCNMRDAFSKYFENTDRLMEAFPSYLKGTKWDTILVDAPPGGGGIDNPGRMKPIYWASQLINPGGHIFVHDMERTIELRFSQRYLVELQGRTKSMVGNLGHFAPAAVGSHLTSHINDFVDVSNKRTVIIAAAINYGISEFKNFIIPLRKVYMGDVVLFVDSKLSHDVVELCKQYNIFTRVLPTGSRLGVKGNRYIGYYEVCNDYQWCLATDFRDVFFQANPFRKVPNVDLILPGEHKHVKMGYRKDRPICTPSISTTCTCPYNAGWIKTCWGNDFLLSIADEIPICSGTILGTPNGFADLKDKMLAEMTRTSSKSGCTARDQGHLNYIYFAKRLDVSTIIQSQGDGIVNTVGYITPRNSINEFINDDFVVNNDGSVSAVVHQYDRFPALVTLLKKHVERKDFISNKKYIKMCDMSYKTRSNNNFRFPLKPNSLICAKGDTKTLTDFFNLDIQVPFTLITIENDDAVPQDPKWLNHKYLKKWYGWNSNHPDVIPIPIGLNHDSQLKPMQMVTPITPKIEMVLSNFKQDTRERVSLFKKVSDLEFVHVEAYSKKWHNTQDMITHYEVISKYKWTLCPRGAGQDTHRLWEALYLGSIPIVLKSSISNMYEGLPVIQLNNWDELSLAMLQERSKYLSKDRTNAYFKHWENIIRSSTMNKIISYSLYGSNPRYTDGALANAKLVKQIYPGWRMRVYYDRSVPQRILNALKDDGVELIDMSDSSMNKMSWRFLAAVDSQRFCARDIDSRLSMREAEAVKEWIESGKKFHVMRDHPSHSNYAMSGGMWCATSIPNMKDMLTNVRNQAYLQDMNFLNKVIWPLAQKSLLQHDSFSCDKFGGGRPFPTARKGWEHVGSVYIGGKMRQVDVDILKNAKQPCVVHQQRTDVRPVRHGGEDTKPPNSFATLHPVNSIARSGNSMLVKLPFSRNSVVVTPGIANNQWWKSVSSKQWELETFKVFNQEVQRGGIYVGFGEWVGVTGMFAMERASKTILMEPDTYVFKELKRNIGQSVHLANGPVYLDTRCISNSVSTIRMKANGGSGSTIIKGVRDNFPTINVDCLTLPLLFDEYSIDTASKVFLKIDTEGAESLILPSLLPWLKSIKSKPTIFVSMHGVADITQRTQIATVLNLYPYYAIIRGRNKEPHAITGPGVDGVMCSDGVRLTLNDGTRFTEKNICSWCDYLLVMDNKRDKCRKKVFDDTYPTALKPSPVHKPIIWISMSLCLDGVKKHSRFFYDEAIVWATKLWIFFKQKVIVTVVTQNNNWEEHDVVKRLRKYGALIVYQKPMGKLGCITTSQFARLWAFENEVVHKNDIIVMSDADAFPRSNDVVNPLYTTPPNIKAWIWQYTYSVQTGYTFPMSIIALRKSDLQNILGQYGPSNALLHSVDYDDKKRWGIDQRVITRALLKNKICSITNPDVWKRVKLNPTPFQDTNSCWHGTDENRHGQNKSWLHLSANTNIGDMQKIAKNILHTANS